MNNDYKEECWKRYLENQKYEQYERRFGRPTEKENCNDIYKNN